MEKQMVYDIREVTTLRELFEGSVETFGDRTAFLYAESDGIVEISYQEAFEQMKALATYLRSLVPQGSRIAIVGKNSYHWALTYLAVACGVGIVVPLDKDLRADELEYLIARADCAAVMYSPEETEKMEEISTEAHRLCMDGMREYLAKGLELIGNGDRSYAEHTINPHALGLILFTSGTTGASKGVMLSQYNICSNVTGVMRRLKIDPEDRAFSIAPLHHTFECTAGFLTVIYSGGSIAYNSSLRKLQAEIKLFHPTILAAVPLIMNTIRNNIIKHYHKVKGGKMVLSLQRGISDFFGPKAGKGVFNEVNETLGGRLRLIVCGAAPLEPETYKDYERFGVKVYIGYGLTETSPVITVHNDFYCSPYDVGMPISDTKVRLDNVNEEGIGELLVKGPGVMMGYYEDPEATAEVMENGWFHTGDLAKKTEDGAYVISGRIKSMIVTAGGKKVFPEELETFLNQYDIISECLVYESNSEDTPKIAVAIYPNEEAIEKRLQKKGLAKDSPEYTEETQKLMQEAVTAVNQKFPTYKHIRKIVMRKTEFEKTTTRKIKRSRLINYDNN